VEVVELKNKSLLRKWLYKLMNEEGMCQELLCNKYVKKNDISDFSKPYRLSFLERFNVYER
jgi:hypothetical protein